MVELIGEDNGISVIALAQCTSSFVGFEICQMIMASLGQELFLVLLVLPFILSVQCEAFQMGASFDGPISSQELEEMKPDQNVSNGLLGRRVGKGFRSGFVKEERSSKVGIAHRGCSKVPQCSTRRSFEKGFR